jgi:1,4-dihydroxy-2-naphthoyl-CoA synthase
VALDTLTPYYYASEESQELREAFNEKRRPDRSRFGR